jgi:hypothetical protein
MRAFDECESEAQIFLFVAHGRATDKYVHPTLCAPHEDDQVYAQLKSRQQLRHAVMMRAADVAVCIEDGVGDAARICLKDRQRVVSDLAKHPRMWLNMFLLLFLLCTF